MAKVTLTSISDSHGQHLDIELPGGDILLHCGDIAHHRGDGRELMSFLGWLQSQPYEHKIFICGNHDFLFQDHPAAVAQMIAKYDVTYLQDSSVKACGLNIWGSPWQPAFHNWAYNLPRGGPELAAKWAAIPDDTNILLTHGPPYGVGDMTSRGEAAGCTALLRRLPELKQLKASFGGHIHEGYGIREVAGVPCINCSVLDYKYRLVNKPITIEVEV